MYSGHLYEMERRGGDLNRDRYRWRHGVVSGGVTHLCGLTYLSQKSGLRAAAGGRKASPPVRSALRMLLLLCSISYWRSLYFYDFCFPFHVLTKKLYLERSLEFVLWTCFLPTLCSVLWPKVGYFCLFVFKAFYR